MSLWQVKSQMNVTHNVIAQNIQTISVTNMHSQQHAKFMKIWASQDFKSDN